MPPKKSKTDTENLGDISFYPIKTENQWAFDLYKMAYQSFWTPEEISYLDDKRGVTKVDKFQLYLLKCVLGFFASADRLVNDNIAVRFYNEVPEKEAKAFYSIQIAMEQIHAQSYGDQIEAIIPDKIERDEIFQSFDRHPVIKKMTRYIKSITTSRATLSSRILKMGCVEGIMFSAMFVVIFYFKKNGTFPGIAMANELISRDEGLHANFAFSYYLKRCPPLSELLVTNIFKECVELASEFANQALEVGCLGITKSLLRLYIESVANFWLEKIHLEPLYPKSKNPFPFMEMIAMDNKTNFFERRVSEYSKATKRDETGKDSALKILEDF